jgi:hypothetical protein
MESMEVQKVKNNYFLPFSRQSVYASMMPVSFNYTLMNSLSILSKITHYEVTYSLPTSSESDLSLATLNKCMQVEFRSPKIIWPFFANINLRVATHDSPECRNLKVKDVTLSVDLKVLNVGPKSPHSASQDTLVTQFKLAFDYIPTPARDRRLLFD